MNRLYCIFQVIYIYIYTHNDACLHIYGIGVYYISCIKMRIVQVYVLSLTGKASLKPTNPIHINKNNVISKLLINLENFIPYVIKWVTW